MLLPDRDLKMVSLEAPPLNVRHDVGQRRLEIGFAPSTPV
jgi:hypothetical protein